VGWVLASIIPPLVTHKSGEFSQSKSYPVAVEGFQDALMAFYWKRGDFGIWKITGYSGDREVVYYYDLPAIPNDHEATKRDTL
jgi:hypothetical protein